MLSATSLKLVPKALGRSAARSMQSNVMSGPPRVRISPAEKLAHGLAISLGISAVPMWVLVHIKHYRGTA